MRNIGFHANGFIIFDFAPENEMQIGRWLEEAICDSINKSEKSLFCERHRCNNADEFIAELAKLKRRINATGEIPYIHIGGHGSENHLKLLDHSYLEWSIIFEHFREINALCKNNLFFSSSACHAAYAFRAASITKPSPVFGMLAPEQAVLAGDVKDGFVKFYTKLIIEGDLNKAFEGFDEAAGGKNYALIFSQLLFEKAAYQYIRQYCMGKGKRARLEKLVSCATEKTGLPPKKLRKQIKKEIFGSQALALSKFHRQFMLIDKFPENSERFTFDAVKFEKRVRDGT